MDRVDKVEQLLDSDRVDKEVRQRREMRRRACSAMGLIGKCCLIKVLLFVYL